MMRGRSQGAFQSLARAAAAQLAWIGMLLGLVATNARAESFDCIMDPAQRVKIGTPVTGVLKSVLVTRGDRVREGDVIARLDDTVEAANYAVAAKQAHSTEAIEAQRVRVDLAKSKLDRAIPLAEKSIVPPEKLDSLRSDYDISRRDLNAEMIKHEIAELDMKRAEASLSQRTIRSPLSGIVLEKHLSPGEFVNQEAYIFILVQLNPLYVEAYIPVTYYGRIGTGMTGIVEPAEPVGGRYTATVTVTDQVFDAASGTYGVRLELKNAGNLLPGGQRCHVEFDLTKPIRAQP